MDQMMSEGKTEAMRKMHASKEIAREQKLCADHMKMMRGSTPKKTYVSKGRRGR